MSKHGAKPSYFYLATKLNDAADRNMEELGRTERAAGQEDKELLEGVHPARAMAGNYLVPSDEE